MSWDGNPMLYNGSIVIIGSNRIRSSNMSNCLVTDIPLKIANNPLAMVNGMLKIKGSTLPIADIYIEGKRFMLIIYIYLMKR